MALSVCLSVFSILGQYEQFKKHCPDTIINLFPYNLLWDWSVSVYLTVGSAPDFGTTQAGEKQSRYYYVPAPPYFQQTLDNVGGTR